MLLTRALTVLSVLSVLTLGVLAFPGRGATQGCILICSTTTTTTTTVVKPPLPNLVPAYWLVASDGGIFGFGGAPFYGSTGSMVLNKPIVGMASTPDSKGYWLVASDGGIFSFGDAHFYGSTGSMVLNKPIVGMAATPDGGGYWLVASDGGIFAFGDAQYFGSMGGRPLNKPVVGMAEAPGGGGYWLVASDGGIFAFGSATFYGSTGNITLNKPIVAMTPTADGKGYWFTASDGGVFAYGDAPFYGSLGGIPLTRPVVAMAATPDTKGYWFSDSGGSVTSFGDAGYWGSAPANLNKPIVGMAEATVREAFSGPYAHGAYGYDVSVYQCNGALPPTLPIGVVQVNGFGFGTANTCLSTEAKWAAAGLNLYTYLSCGDYSSGDQPCTEQEGFAEAQFAYQEAVTAGVDPAVDWWLDVEGTGWGSTTAGNAALVQGALNGLQAESVPSVGIYASPDVWNTIVGDYTPGVPYWAADWGLSPQSTCANFPTQFPKEQLPSGPLVLVQYSSPSATYPVSGVEDGFDNDYAC
jgi:hypothetical protein